MLAWDKVHIAYAPTHRHSLVALTRTLYCKRARTDVIRLDNAGHGARRWGTRQCRFDVEELGALAGLLSPPLEEGAAPSSRTLEGCTEAVAGPDGTVDFGMVGARIMSAARWTSAAAREANRACDRNDLTPTTPPNSVPSRMKAVAVCGTCWGMHNSNTCASTWHRKPGCELAQDNQTHLY